MPSRGERKGHWRGSQQGSGVKFTVRLDEVAIRQRATWRPPPRRFADLQNCMHAKYTPRAP